MSLLESAIAIVAPHECLGCKQQGQLLCYGCSLNYFLNLPSRCYRCQSLTTDFAVCPKCRRYSSLKRVFVRTFYEGFAKEVLHAYKYERARAANAVIANAMLDAYPLGTRPDVIVGVPTATSRKRQRGYDQTHLLVKQISKKLSAPYASPVSRLTQTRQVGAARKQRLTQLEGAFLVHQLKSIKGQNLLLVDDVITTGATLETVASILKETGAASVSALVFAQKAQP